MIIDMIKTMLEFFKEEYKLCLKSASNRKNSENGSTYRKTSQTKNGSFKQMSRRNSNRTHSISDFNFTTVSSGKGRPLDHYLSNNNLIRPHRKSTNGGKGAIIVVPKGNTSHKNSMIGDISAIPMQP
jgi:hypothetical protein